MSEVDDIDVGAPEGGLFEFSWLAAIPGGEVDVVFADGAGYPVFFVFVFEAASASCFPEGDDDGEVAGVHFFVGFAGVGWVAVVAFFGVAVEVAEGPVDGEVVPDSEDAGGGDGAEVDAVAAAFGGLEWDGLCYEDFVVVAVSEE